MIRLYTLKHRDADCGVLTIDTDDGKLQSYASYGNCQGPFLGNSTLKNMKRWWTARCVPADRKAMQEVIRLSGCFTSGEYLAKNLALSMTDCYWLCPEGLDLKWEDVNLRRSGIVMGGKVPYHNATSYDPNASLGGQMEKYWDLLRNEPTLVKTAGTHYGQQALNELFATNIHKKQDSGFPFVKYDMETTADGDLCSVCKSFTSDRIEFVPAMEILDSEKIKNDEALYDAYIRICSEHGLDKQYISDYMDYQTLSDFVISNTDEHLLNFGALRDSTDMNFKDTAPIFDSGNSMFYSDIRRRPFERYELLERKITTFHDSEEAMLKHVKNRTVLKEDLLPSLKEVLEFYADRGVPEDKSMFIAKNYEIKVRMLREFQKGKSISLYREQKKYKNSLHSGSIPHD